jgi:hypothetical protein
LERKKSSRASSRLRFLGNVEIKNPDQTLTELKKIKINWTSEVRQNGRIAKNKTKKEAPTMHNV